jgi:hypothetical protein
MHPRFGIHPNKLECARAWDFKPMGASVNHLKFLELDDMGEDLPFHFSSNMLICSNTVSDKTNMLERGLNRSKKSNLLFKLTHTQFFFQFVHCLLDEGVEYRYKRFVFHFFKPF